MGFFFADHCRSFVCDSRPGLQERSPSEGLRLISSNYRKRHLLCRHFRGEGKTRARKQRMKRKFSEAETKGKFLAKAVLIHSVKSLQSERDAENESDVIVEAAREPQMLAATPNRKKT